MFTPISQSNESQWCPIQYVCLSPPPCSTTLRVESLPCSPPLFFSLLFSSHPPVCAVGSSSAWLFLLFYGVSLSCLSQSPTSPTLLHHTDGHWKWFQYSNNIMILFGISGCLNKWITIIWNFNGDLLTQLKRELVLPYGMYHTIWEYLSWLHQIVAKKLAS